MKSFESKKKEVTECLEQQLCLFYDLQASLRISSYGDLRSMGELLNIWTRIHHQQLQLRTHVKSFIYEYQSPIQLGPVKTGKGAARSARKRKRSGRRAAG